MMAGFQNFERDIRIATASLEPRAINAALAQHARQELRKVIASGEASPVYDRFVNGVKGAPEAAVRAPGPIVYEFVNWPLVIRAALAELRKRSPVRTGRYASGFVVMADQAIARDFGAIRPDAEVVIFNARPYTRKVEMGIIGSGRPHVLATKRVLAARFNGAFIVETRFLTIGPGIHPEVPYRLRHSSGRRKDRQAGQPISYPALIINRA